MAASMSLCAHLACADVAVSCSAVGRESRRSDAFACFSGLRPAAFTAHRSSGRRTALPSRSVLTAVSVSAALSSISPVGDRVLVKVEQAEERTTGGLFLPSSAQAKPLGGTVVAVGDGRTAGEKTVPVAIETGSHVVFSKYAGTEVDYEGATHVLLKEDDVVGRLEGDDVAQLQPFGDRVVIKVKDAEDTTAGGVLLTESAKEKPVVGTVVAVGPGHLSEDGSRRALEVTVGATVLYSKYAANEFKSKNGHAYVVLREGDVMAQLS